MAKEIQEQLEANKEKNRPPQASKPANQKDKASKAPHKKKAAGTHGAEISSKSKAFPGTGAATPKKIEKATIYTCPKSSSWRVKKTGDKKDPAFSWKKEEPKHVWAKVIDYMATL